MKNDFELDTQPKKKQDFLKRIRIWIGVAILLTGIMVIAGIYYTVEMFVAASIVIPRLGGYQSSGFEICSYGSFVLIDGMFLLPGLLLIVLGRIIMAGFVMQKELDEIL